MSENFIKENKTILENLGIDIFPENRRYWLVRTQGGKYYNYFVNENFVGIEWDKISDLDLINDKDEDDLKAEVVLQYPKIEKPGYPARQILRFAHQIRKGDIVLIPSEKSDWISIGEIMDDEMYIYEEDEDFESLLESLDDEDQQERQILKKRRKVSWIKSVKKEDLDPYLYSIIYTHSAVGCIDKYSAFIDRMLSQFYIKGNEGSFTYKVNKKKDIPNMTMMKFLTSNQKLIEYLVENADENLSESIDLENLIFKMNVQSKGILEFKGTIKTILLIGLGTMALCGGKFNVDLLGSQFEISTEGLPGIIKTIADTKSKEDTEMKKTIEAMKKSEQELEIGLPDIKNLELNESAMSKDEENIESTEKSSKEATDNQIQSESNSKQEQE